MDRLVIVVSAILLLTSLLVDGSPDLDGHNSDQQLANNYAKRKMPMWFGPRLGRRKRNPHEEFFSSPLLEREQLEVLRALIAAANDNKKPFTPRLGRDSAEDYAQSDRWVPDSDLNELAQRSPPFAPRLGRRMYPFSPRLGRENDRA